MRSGTGGARERDDAMKVSVTAPGKVVVLGEYAVLEGAPALVMAVNRRVRVTLSMVGDSCCSVTMPGWSTASYPFRLGDAGPEWLGHGSQPRLPLVERVLERFFAPALGRARGEPFDLVLDSAELTQPGDSGVIKLGLGSSAALTVALYHALGYYAALHQCDAAPPVLEELIETHSSLQGRRGSGLDVATSLYGGLVEYSRRQGPEVRAWTLPSALEYCFVWSGQSAATAEFLARLDDRRRHGRGRFEAVIGPLRDLAEAGARAARADAAEEFLRIMDAYADALENLGKEAGADILSAPHRHLRRQVARCGAVYKPCGAGGGDIGIAMSADPGALARFREQAAADGFKVLSLSCDQSGVTTLPGNQFNAR